MIDGLLGSLLDFLLFVYGMILCMGIDVMCGVGFEGICVCIDL